MRLVVDESVDLPIVERLRRRGFEVTFVAELEPGLHDDAVLALANERNALLHLIAEMHRGFQVTMETEGNL